MSSDPIEVLREAVVNWQLHRHGADADPGSPANMRYDEACDRLDAALASLSAPKPEGEWVMVPRDSTPEMWEAGMNCHSPDDTQGDYLEKAWGAMLAAAPKPPPMNDNAVADNESAPVNDKPESAEAVAWMVDGGVEQGLSFDKAAAEKMAFANAGTVRPLVYADTAPPRPEASAPVGVEAIIEAFDEITGLCRHLRQGGPAPEDLHDLSGALDEAIGIAGNMLDALSQQPAASEVSSGCKADSGGKQPAAVDGATRRDAERYRYLRRPEAWKENWITERGASAIFIGDGRRAEAKDGEALDAAIDRILAGHQQGGPQE